LGVFPRKFAQKIGCVTAQEVIFCAVRARARDSAILPGWGSEGCGQRDPFSAQFSRAIFRMSVRERKWFARCAPILRGTGDSGGPLPAKSTTYNRAIRRFVRNIEN